MEEEALCAYNNNKETDKVEEESNNIDIEDEEQEEEDHEILRGRICSHPLYELLLQTHLECLKVGQISENDGSSSGDMMIKEELDEYYMNYEASLGQTELDHFMKAYCLALGKMKEAMEEPQHKSMSFITSMHLKLNHLLTASTSTHRHDADQPPPTSLSGEARDR